MKKLLLFLAIAASAISPIVVLTLLYDKNQNVELNMSYLIICSCASIMNLTIGIGYMRKLNDEND